MEEVKDVSQNLSLESIVTNVVQIPGVKVNRDKFLAEMFASTPDKISEIVELGPIEAGVTRESLLKISNKLILTRTSESSAISFAAGIPGGFAMAATIPGDIMQFFGMSLRLAQELSYLYGAQDLWENGEIDDDRVKNQLILYCGVMFGVSSAAAGVRVLSAQVAKTALKKLPQKALTKTFWYPLIKQIGKVLSIKVTKTTVAHGISKVIPVIGGVISGGLNFASMMPMARRLLNTLDSASFGYTEEDLDADLEIIESIDEEQDPTEQEASSKFEKAKEAKNKITDSAKKLGSGISGIFAGKHGRQKENISSANNNTEDVFAAIEKLSKLKDMGAVSQEEFDAKKAELLSRI